MSTTTRVALIGYGFAGRTFHAPLIAATPGLALTVVATRQRDRVEADLPGIRVESDPLAAATAADVDLVVIASPNDTHVPLALAALQAGHAVVVDKPFTITLDDARQVAGVAEAKGLLLSVFQNRRWDSDFLAAQRIIADGRLGEIVHVEAHFDRYRPVVQARWREESGPGSGLWYDLGPHLVDQALSLFGLPESVSARLVRQRAGAVTDDWAHVLLDYGRLQVVLHGSMLNAAGSPRFTLHGTEGSWIKTGSDPQEKQLLAGMRPGAPGWGVDPQPGLFYDGATGATTPTPSPVGDYPRYYRDLRAALVGAAPNPVSPAQAITVMAVIQTAAESAILGRALPLPLTPGERAAWALTAAPNGRLKR